MRRTSYHSKALHARGSLGWDNPYDPFDLGRPRETDYDRDFAVYGKDQKMTTDLHYSQPDSDKERTVFGRAKPGLFYNYSDRLHGDAWRAGCEKADAAGLTRGTARWFEAVLNVFHRTDNVDLQHVILGVNRSTAYSYLVFGYTYSSPAEEAGPSAE